jgi:hypothetical protein
MTACIRATRALENPEVLIICMDPGHPAGADVLSSVDPEIELVIGGLISQPPDFVNGGTLLIFTKVRDA